MGREKRSLNPVEAHRRSQKRKTAERKKAIRKEVLSKIPISKRDPSKLLIEIERLRTLEAQNKLDGSGKLKRSHLEDQFVSLNKAREKAGLPTMVLPEFDPEAYLNKLKTPSRPTEEQHTINHEFTALDIPVPDDEPYEAGAPGLPPYHLEESSNKAETISNVIIAEPSVPRSDHLEAQVDQFLHELDL